MGGAALPAPGAAVAEQLAAKVCGLAAGNLPASVRRRAEEILIDIVGLCVAARGTDYVRALTDGLDAGGPCTAFGHAATYSPADAALINGTAAHGEDFDDTFEGGPVHSGVVIVPAVLAACERFGRDGRSALAGIAIGTEVLCRLSTVVPKAVHKAGFHPTGVLGAPAAAVAVAAALGLNPRQTVDAIGIAASMASGIIEYLAEGAWTKRMHPGWAAQAGVQAARLAATGFYGPRTVFEGTHGLFNAFAHTSRGDYEALVGDLGRRWVMETLTFKPYATGTMNQPYIDCALRLARHGIRPEDIAEVVCETAEGYVHRLWDPLPAKQRPANAYAAKFSTPFNVAVAFLTGSAGLEAFTEETARDERILALAGKVRYVVDPDNPYPKAYTGHVKLILKDGREFEERQPHIRGGAQEPLSREDIEQKFRLNAAFGGWPEARGEAFLDFARKAFDGPLDFSAFRA